MSKRKRHMKDLMSKIRKLEKLVANDSSAESSSDDDKYEARAPTDNENLREVFMIVDESPNTHEEQEGGATASDEKHKDVSEEKSDLEPLSESVINILGDDGTIITSLGLAMTDVIKENPHCIKILEYISDLGWMLCHMHYEISKNRRNIIASELNKDVKDLMDNCHIEGLLFGNDFTEKIRASRAAEKLSAQSLKITASKVPKDKPKQNLNYRGPLRPQAPACQSGQTDNFHRRPLKKSAHQQRPSNKKHPPQRRH